MPNMFGGDQCSKDYAPHMWIGDHFIGGTGKTVKTKKWIYYVGRTGDETIVAERHPRKDGEFSSRTKLVPNSRIPTMARKAVAEGALSAREAEVAGIEKLFNGG